MSTARAALALALISLSAPAFAGRSPTDTDRDGLSDAVEGRLGTNRRVADTDRDGLSDGYEVNTSRTNPLVADTDGDGLSDGEERAEGTDPLLADTDGDGVSDSDDLFPLDGAEWADADCDGIGDNADPDDNDNGIDDDLEISYGAPLLDAVSFPLLLDIIVCPWDMVGPISLSNPECEAHQVDMFDDGSLSIQGWPGEWAESPAPSGHALAFAFPGFTTASMQYLGERVAPLPGALACFEGPSQALGGWYNASTGASGSYWFDVGQWSGCVY